MRIEIMRINTDELQRILQNAITYFWIRTAKRIPTVGEKLRQQAMIPKVPTPGGGRFPMLMMGDGAAWGRPTNFTTWLQLVGKGAGIRGAHTLGLIRSAPDVSHSISQRKGAHLLSWAMALPVEWHPRG